MLPLIRVFAYLSLLTVGGGMAAFPELENLTVNVHHWLTFPQLIHLYSVGQMAPGPNMMMIVSIGEWVAGLAGAAVVLIAFFLPTALLAFVVGRLWIRLEHWPWRASIQRGLAPVSIGLLLAGCLTMARGAVNRTDDRHHRGRRLRDPAAQPDQPGPSGPGGRADWPVRVAILSRAGRLLGAALTRVRVFSVPRCDPTAPGF